MTRRDSESTRYPGGVLVIDKPAGLSSARVVAVVKRLLHVGKVGHAGTLDPFATGVLIVCIGHATRLARFWLDGVKTYAAELCLGVETDTQDVTGNVIATGCFDNISTSDIHTVMASFIGVSEQFPPIFSALKHQGVPLYKLARKGTPFQKPPRRVQIYRLDIQDMALPCVRFEVTCSSGTYIRTLCADIGKMLGCGAYLKSLRRIASSRFTLADALSLPELETLVESGDIAARMIGMSESLPDMPCFQADKPLTDRLKYGMIITDADIPVSVPAPETRFIKILDDDTRLLSVLCHDPLHQRYMYCCSFM